KGCGTPTKPGSAARVRSDGSARAATAVAGRTSRYRLFPLLRRSVWAARSSVPGPASTGPSSTRSAAWTARSARTEFVQFLLLVFGQDLRQPRIDFFLQLIECAELPL